jgi:hypothetical protein
MAVSKRLNAPGNARNGNLDQKQETEICAAIFAGAEL